MRGGYSVYGVEGAYSVPLFRGPILPTRVGGGYSVYGGEGSYSASLFQVSTLPTGVGCGGYTVYRVGRPTLPTYFGGLLCLLGGGGGGRDSVYGDELGPSLPPYFGGPSLPSGGRLLFLRR